MVLAKYYDALVKDDEATAGMGGSNQSTICQKAILWSWHVEVVKSQLSLSKEGYHVSASDLSQDMINAAKSKPGSEAISWSVMDMSEFEDEHTYDGILCLCDSFNYLLSDEQVDHMFTKVYEHLREHGVFIMDMHFHGSFR